VAAGLGLRAGVRLVGRVMASRWEGRSGGDEGRGGDEGVAMSWYLERILTRDMIRTNGFSTFESWFPIVVNDLCKEIQYIFQLAG
jgi:hypothetical protein